MAGTTATKKRNPYKNKAAQQAAHKPKSQLPLVDVIPKEPDIPVNKTIPAAKPLKEKTNFASSQEIRNPVGRPRKNEPVHVKRKAPAVEDTNLKNFFCVCCGMVTDHPAGRFYKSQSSMYKANDGYVPICSACLQQQFDELKVRYGERNAMIFICHYADMPFYYSAYDGIIQTHDTFKIGMYFRQMNNKQYYHKTFVHTLLDKKELQIEESQFEKIKEEERWSREDNHNKISTLRILGYDPFEGYTEVQRRYLFNNIIGYLSEDGIEDDTYKLSQIVQLVNNNYQITQIDMALAKLNVITEADDIKTLQATKKSLVDANDKIAKENGISAKNRLNKQPGQGTLTYLQRQLREMNIPNAETNYYDQLKGEGTQWAANMSFKAIKENGYFDENDTKDILEKQYRMINELQSVLDDVEEQNRLLLIEVDKYKPKKGKSKKIPEITMESVMEVTEEQMAEPVEEFTMEIAEKSTAEIMEMEAGDS